MSRIIIADDDPVICHLVTSILEREGHYVASLPDGNRVADLAEARAPNLLILDVAMPGKSGLDVLREIRAQIGWSMPVLMLTGRSGREDERIAYGAGANDYLRKPVDPDELVVRTEAILEKAALRVA